VLGSLEVYITKMAKNKFTESDIKAISCPFCGEKEIGCQHTHEGEYAPKYPFSPFARCGCSNCGARGPIESTVENAIKSWNKAFENICKQFVSNEYQKVLNDVQKYRED
jgi:hypothetical protein